MPEDFRRKEDGTIDIFYYFQPMLRGLHNETIKRLEEITDPKLAMWVGMGAAVTIFHEAIETGHTLGISSLQDVIRIMGKKLEREKNIGLGYPND
jgi:hypothetical protein